MSEAMSAVLTQAMKLSATERGELIERLVDSLDPPDGLDELTEDEFTAELHRRAADLRNDPTTGIPWNDVKEMR